MEKLNEHFSPKRNSTFERHLFRALQPEDGECVNKFLSRLRGQAAKCEFGSTEKEVQEIYIKDKLIDSWAPMDLKKRLLEKESDLKSVVEMCQVYQQIKSQTRSMQPSEAVATVQRVSTNDNGKINECGRCGRKGHFGSDNSCPARSARCNRCGIGRHFAMKCKSKKRTFTRDNGFNEGDRKRFKPARVRCIQEEDGDSEGSLREFSCFKIGDDEEDELIECSLGDQILSMFID